MQDIVKKAIVIVQRYIGENLTEELTLAKLAKVANYSPYHLERIFKKQIGSTLFEYIRKLRLTAAAKILRDNDVKIMDTALDFLFDSHEGFTRAFSKEFGVSPFVYKKCPIPVKYFMPYFLQSKKPLKEKTMQTKFLFTQVIERPERKAIIKRGIKAKGYFEYCEEVGCDVWGVLCSVKEALFEPAGYWFPHSMREGKSEYVQGVEVPFEYNGAVTEGYDLIEMPACSYMVFNGEPYNEEDFEEAIGEVWQAIERFKPENYGYQWSDKAPRFQLAPQGERGYIEARPITKFNE